MKLRKSAVSVVRVQLMSSDSEDYAPAPRAAAPRAGRAAAAKKPAAYVDLSDDDE